MKIRVLKLAANNVATFKELILLFEEVFEMKDLKISGEAHLASLLARKDFFVFVALADNKVVGGLTAYALQQYYSASPLMFIYDLAVKAGMQRQGIGKALTANLAEHCRANDFKEMFVLADKDDDHAIAFYQSTGAIGSNAVSFNYVLI